VTDKREVVSIDCWELRAGGEPLARARRQSDALAADQVLIEVAGCGVCHTDIGYIFEGVRTRHALPLTLGHEIAGRVVAAGADHEHLISEAVIVPAIIPCGRCELCAAGRGTICRAQIFPGCDVHGGFASHVVVPAAGLCVVDGDALARSEVDLIDLAVLGDAISTPYQAIVRAELRAGELAIFIGAGGVGGFGVQIAAALGAHVIALDIDDKKLAPMAEHGAASTLNVGAMSPREVRKHLRGYAKERGLPATCWKIFETSGAAAGQRLAFGLLTFGAILSVIGYTLEPVTLRLSNLMAFDAVAQGSWGCLPEHYPAVLELVLTGKVAVAPFVERRPMSQINETLTALRDHELARRPILIPDFE
jgi:6-hydroxycyclohex-1-ene-1-carbonyl-CoA dehydrogenase